MLVLSCISNLYYMIIGHVSPCPQTRMLRTRIGRTRRPQQEPYRRSAQGGTRSYYSGVLAGQRKPASGTRGGDFDPHREQVAPPLRAARLGRIARWAAVRQAAHLRHGVSRPAPGAAGGVAACRLGALGWSGLGGETGSQRACGLAYLAARGHLSATPAHLVREYRSGVCPQSRRGGGIVPESPAECPGPECGRETEHSGQGEAFRL